MKKNLVWSVILLMAGAIITSCSDDKNDGPGIIDDGEGNVVIQVFDVKNSGGLRAFDPNVTEPAEAGESTLASSVAVFVYDQDGALDYSNLSLPVDNATGKTSKFKVPAGYKFFYVFSNSQVKDMASGSNVEDMEKQVAFIKTFDGDIPQPIAVNTAFSLGTLWKKEVGFDVQDQGYGGVPVTVGLEVGRAAAKVRLQSISKQTAPNVSPLLGNFDAANAIYRLRSVPDRYYIVGQFDESGNYPPTNGLRYISAVHEKDPGTSEIKSDAFVDYTWNRNMNPGAGGHYYAVENTTMKMKIEGNDEENLYYGNTTYVQFRITYTPDGAELYDPATQTAGATLATDGTFYTAIFDNSGSPVRRMYASNPENEAGISDTKVYTNGVMFYKFSVRDKSETGIERQCCVIRNHYYEITVDNINNIGEPDDIVPPETPIEETDPDVEISIKVLDWYKITTGEDL